MDQKATSGLITNQSTLAGTDRVGQTFTPSLTGIDWAEFLFLSPESNGGGTAQVLVRNDGPSGSILGTSTAVEVPINVSPYLVHFEFSTRVTLVPNNVYFLEAVMLDGNNISVYSSRENPYEAGGALIQGTFPNNFDYWFREGLTIPEPSSCYIFIIGLVGLTGVSPRKKRQLS